MISSIRKFFGGRTAARAFVIATAAVLVGACDDDDPIDPGPSHSWAADLAGEGEYEGFAGDLVVTANSVSFNADLEISGAEAERTYSWGIFAGSCDDLGNRVGAASLYGDIEADDDGNGAEDASGTGGMISGDDYVAQVWTEVEEEDEVVACAELVAADD